MFYNYYYMNPIIRDFSLFNKEQLTTFFPDEKGSLQGKINRLIHFFIAGVWVDEEALFKFASSNPSAKASEFVKGKAVERKVIRLESKMDFKNQTFFESLAEKFEFVMNFIRHPIETGAILPSSTGLAKEIVHNIPKNLHAAPRRIIEIGAGTGVFTAKILKRMNPHDTLTVVEFDPKFCEILRKRYGHIKNVAIIEGDILEHKGKYDYVVSGLPLNAFSAEMVTKFIAKYKDLTNNNGIVSYFQYRFVTSIRKLFMNAKEKANIDSITEQKEEFFARYRFQRNSVILNVPVAEVLHHRISTHSMGGLM